jgi:hypothetical protein
VQIKKENPTTRAHRLFAFEMPTIKSGVYDTTFLPKMVPRLDGMGKIKFIDKKPQNNTQSCYGHKGTQKDGNKFRVRLYEEIKR